MPDSRPVNASLCVIGGGPAGLMAAETACAAGLEVDVYEAKGSVARKFLIAGKGGLNLTHSESFEHFVARYGERSSIVAGWLQDFGAEALREWSRGLGVETFIGSSGRVFPADLKAAPLLRGWVRRLRDDGVRFHVHHRWTGWDDRTGELVFETDGNTCRIRSHATVLALGGGSWPQLGSDGAWQEILRQRNVDIAPLEPANCGFDIGWSEHFARHHAGAPLKPVVALLTDAQGQPQALQGEGVVTGTGIEGSLVYALSSRLRQTIQHEGTATLALDLAPGRDAARLLRDLSRPRNGRSMSEHLRRQAGLSGVKVALLYEILGRPLPDDATRLANTIKHLPLILKRPRPLAEAISSAGGLRLEALDDQLMIKTLPGVFAAGEMLDWEAPTGGYLFTASFASGRRAAQGATAWLKSMADA